jgi:hypothetical protein
LRGLWVAEDVGDVAPKNSKIDEKILTAEGDTSDGVFSLSELTTSARFTIKPGKSKKKSAESADE